MNWLQRTLESGWQKPNLLSYSLLPFSLLYLFIIKLRRLAYSYGFFKSHTFPVPVIVVGNITVGGTGKTPLVIHLVEQLKKQGYKPGVISRGYGGQAESWPQYVAQDSDPLMIGDEPLLIARRTNTPVVVGPKRVDNIKLLIEQYNCNLIISDDGLQHYAMQRDIEIIINDQTRETNNHFLLPAGPYRELRNRLQQCDLLITHVDDEQTVNTYNMKLLAGEPIGLVNKSRLTPESKLHAMAGIGNPQRFFKTCKNAGYEIIEHIFADHYQYQATDISFEDDLPVLMTEKDAVKCFKFADERHYYLPVSAVLSDNFIETLHQLIRKIDK